MCFLLSLEGATLQTIISNSMLEKHLIGVSRKGGVDLKSPAVSKPPYPLQPCSLITLNIYGVIKDNPQSG
jgi:ABC-type cobalamin transport system permease subunit